MSYEAIEFFGVGGVAIMDRDNVAQITVLRDLSAVAVLNGAEAVKRSRCGSPAAKSPRHLVIVNVHLLFNTKRGDVKMCQLHHLMHRAHTVATAIKGAEYGGFLGISAAFMM